LVEWLNNFENKASKEEPQMETFMFQCWWCSTKVTSIAVSFIFIPRFFKLLCTCSYFKFHPTFSILNNFITWNDNKLVFYAWLRLCGATMKCPFTFACGTS
jgi:hypothetical protein